MIDAPLAIGATVFLAGLGIYVVAELVRQCTQRVFEPPTSQREPLWTADPEMLKLIAGIAVQTTGTKPPLRTIEGEHDGDDS